MKYTTSEPRTIKPPATIAGDSNNCCECHPFTPRRVACFHGPAKPGRVSMPSAAPATVRPAPSQRRPSVCCRSPAQTTLVPRHVTCYHYPSADAQISSFGGALDARRPGVPGLSNAKRSPRLRGGRDGQEAGLTLPHLRTSSLSWKTAAGTSATCSRRSYQNRMCMMTAPSGRFEPTRQAGPCLPLVPPRPRPGSADVGGTRPPKPMADS